jgi:GntR family transcriptional regulator, transcriptional repressor for pyruvate dehydrogenase complex
MDDFAPVRAERTFEIIANKVRHQIRDGKLRTGDKLPPERELAQQLGTSRNALREALRSLEHAGLISLHKGARGGAFITDGNPSAVAQSMEDLMYLGGINLANITEARLSIETAVVEIAAAKGTATAFDLLDQNIEKVEELTQARDMDAKAALNMEFHVLLAEATGNPVLVLMMRTLMDLLRSVHRPITAEDTVDIIRSRRRFMRLLRDRQAAAAAAEMKDHLSRLHDLFSRTEMPDCG